MDNAVKFYKDVLHYDNMHVEAVACMLSLLVFISDICVNRV